MPIEQKNDLINIILFSSNAIKHFIIIPFLSFCLYSQTTLFKVEHEEIIMGEIVDENELNLINELVELQTRLYMKDVQKSLESGNIVTRRTNSKTHGCLEGTFQIESNLPKKISKGFITPNSSYKALIRFANGNLGVQSDIIPDGRSVSIKLKSVPGKRVVDKNKIGDVDLHLVSANIFFCNDPQEMIDLFLFDEDKKKWLVKNLFQFRRISSIFKNISVIKNKSIIISNPLEIPYFTPVPFKLGDNQEVKYIIKPCTEIIPYEIPANPSENFLKENMQYYLNQNDACFEFFIQLRKDNMSLDKARIEWKKEDSPYIKVAELIIPKQNFNNPETETLCEDETFYPYNTLLENKPVGNMNRARFVVYQKLSALRMKYNNKEIKTIY